MKDGQIAAVNQVAVYAGAGSLETIAIDAF
jgi:hypothetical protein